MASKDTPRQDAAGAWHRRLARPGTALALTAGWLALCLVLWAVPAVDIAVSSALFRAEACTTAAKTVCGIFPAGHNDALLLARRVLHYLPAVSVGVVAAGLAAAAWGGQGWRASGQRLKAAILLTFLLGPGLLVNGILKAHWGRPRPASTQLFGGDLPFVPAGQWSDACSGNCSFVSGEASGVAVLVFLAALAPAPWRRGTALALGGLALAGAGLRVAFGAHWLSDAVLGAASTFVVFAWVSVALAAVAKTGRRRLDGGAADA